MPYWGWIIIAVVAVAVVALSLVAFVQQRRRARLRDRFGPEYDRTITRTGDRRAGEKELAAREERRSSITIRPLSDTSRMRYLESWREIQTRFIDAPAAAVREADVLVWEVMRERGYPMDDFDQRAADVSVDHPNVVEDYRSAHATAQASERGEATTEDLRQALQHYRALFDELLETPGDEPMAGERQELAADEGVDSREPARSERR